jgi:hypothetical protein
MDKLAMVLARLRLIRMRREDLPTAAELRFGRASSLAFGGTSMLRSVLVERVAHSSQIRFLLATHENDVEVCVSRELVCEHLANLLHDNFGVTHYRSQTKRHTYLLGWCEADTSEVRPLNMRELRELRSQYGLERAFRHPILLA